MAEPEVGEAMFEIGGGAGLGALGTYDVGEGLGRPASGNDLGPVTLGCFFTGDARVVPAVRVGIEAGIAVGGLVKTDERYFGGHSPVGSTLTVWARAKLGWTAISRRPVKVRVGGGLGIERLSEATGNGSVRLDSVTAGPTVGVLVGRGVIAELYADLHAPFRAAIGDQTGTPTGVFFSGGLRVSYVFGIGYR